MDTGVSEHGGRTAILAIDNKPAELGYVGFGPASCINGLFPQYTSRLW